MRHQFLRHKPDITPHRKPNGMRRLRRLGSAAGFMLIAIGASATVFTGTTSWASGSSVTSDSIAVATDAYTYPRTFDTSIEKAVSDLRGADPSAAGTANRFYSAYTSATQDYHTALTSAAQLYAESAAQDPASAKAAYIANFISARSAYFGSLDTARADVVTELAGLNNGAKDGFTHSFDAACNVYETQLDGIVTEITALN